METEGAKANAPLGITKRCPFSSYLEFGVNPLKVLIPPLSLDSSPREQNSTSMIDLVQPKLD